MDILDIVREAAIAGSGTVSGWYLNRRSTKTDRSQDQKQATRQNAEQDWIDRHRPFREDAHDLLQDIGAVVTTACERYLNKKDMEDLKLAEAIMHLANIVRKTKDWHFPVIDLPQLLKQLRALHATVDMFSMAAQTTDYVHRQCAAAYTAQSLLQGSSNEIDRQWAEPPPLITEEARRSHGRLHLRRRRLPFRSQCAWGPVRKSPGNISCPGSSRPNQLP